MRVLIADPPAFTPAYDHALAEDMGLEPDHVLICEDGDAVTLDDTGVDVERRAVPAGYQYVDGIGPSVGGAATSPTAVRPLQSASRRSAHAGTSWSSTRSGSSWTARRTICSRCATLPGGFVLPWKRFQLRTRTLTELAYVACAF